ncbi:glycosyltransferase family 2 protein [Pedobacter sp. ISL-64]|uniref:glycosyltransferase family 2 protein n=1 Tax=Pedobacter sp. ISL-64 TaxID=2819164 RepID=UPI001BE8FA5D|nr:glycosyltransferase family 2 protein [Pedobacter sp. ISL-64]MBT2562761.1 glycosyltransferase [Pedobacter sp. ISL-64]
MIKNNTPLISVIIATYNAGKTLETCLKSIIGQTYRNFEIIVIDAASTDNTIDIIEKYNEYIHKWISEKDSGIYEAWNKGINFSTGDWIGFIGSDDSYYPNALQDYVDHILTCKSDLEYVSSKMDLVNTNDKYIKTLGEKWDWKKSRLMNTIAHPGSLHSRVFFDTYGLFNTKYKICSDYEILLRPGNAFKTSFFNKVTVRMAQGGVSFNEKKLFKEHYQIVTSTGKLNLIIAKYYYCLQIAKSNLKKILRKIGYNI